jgi:hypothetical protein
MYARKQRFLLCVLCWWWCELIKQENSSRAGPRALRHEETVLLWTQRIRLPRVSSIFYLIFNLIFLYFVYQGQILFSRKLAHNNKNNNSVADPHHLDAHPVLHFTLMRMRIRIRILLFTLMQIRIRILRFNLMRIPFRILSLTFPHIWTLQCSKMTL